MKIKEICEKTGLTDRTVRYYIEEGLVSPFYTENYLGRKSFDFSDADLERLKAIALERGGEIAAAIVEIKEGETMTEEEFNQFCVELPRYKRPRRIIFEMVPRNPTGKIEKPVLREKYCRGRLVEAQITG